MARISQHLIDRYSAGPTLAKRRQVARLHMTIRDVLGAEFETFLQGSYRNGTALPDINDVDIVSRLKRVRSPQDSDFWEALFAGIAQRLRVSPRISGTVRIGDKCVKLAGSTGGLSADIVPAIARAALTKDPIHIWSWRAREERPNYPRTHYRNGVTKQERSSNSYKATVRMFKRWRTQYSSMDATAPSFYVECAVHQAQVANFSTYLPHSFLRVGREILSWTRSKVIRSVAGDKDILVDSEWSPDNFEAFQASLKPDIGYVAAALRANTTKEADRLWKLAFGES